ncbi:MAG: dinitrogenase iron-molybdenum cofactor biosynthesis protein, partial [Methanobacteriota archaeon]
RAPYFIVIESETGEYEALENSFAGGAGGVGPKTAQMLVRHGVEALISGQVGDNARDVLTASGIAMYVYRGSGTVRDAFDLYRNNALERAG